MKWRGGRRSSNVEDRRGQRPRGAGIKLGGGATIAVIVISLFLGADPMQMLNLLGGLDTGSSQSNPTSQSNQGGQSPRKKDEQAQFVSVVLADTEDVWNKLFREDGKKYREPGLVLFTDTVRSACGMQSSATGPFYCPGDSKVYIDLGFYRELAKMGGAGDFARAYVIGHEVGHHIQNLTGTSTAVHKKRQRVSKREGNALSVLQELQADCYAGVWAYHAEKDRNLLEVGDVDEGLAAAAAIGDDALQKGAGGRARPESFTHGSSKQRVKWLKRGLNSGQVDKCNTFAN